MSAPVWQSNYVDLCEESTVRFGAACAICSAHYATPVETIAPELVATAVPGSPLAQEIADLKYQRFTEFDSAFRELSITCFRCGKAACPDCWDDDNRMCAECVTARGLNRSPRVGPPGRGPLQDGRLERVATGRYSDIGRPAWLNHLMESEAARMGVVPPAPTPAARQSDFALRSEPGAADHLAAASLVMAVPFEPSDPRLLAGEPTLRVPSAGPVFGQGAIAPLNLDGDAHFMTNEGSATSNMVTCPRCGTANYDFVTRCTVCQLQLIQICPACEKLNAGNVIQCEFCGAGLRRPKGWTDELPPAPLMPQPVLPPAPSAGVPQKRKSATLPPGVQLPPIQAPFIPEPRARERRATRPVTHTGAPALEAAAFAMPAVPAFGPFETPPYPQRHARRSRRMTDMLINGTERLASLVLFAAILVVIGGIVAAEVSPAANAFIASLIHVDVKVTISHFLQQMQQLTQRK